MRLFSLLRNAIETVNVIWSPVHTQVHARLRGPHDSQRTPANHEVVEMLDKQTRGAIPLLHRKGQSLRRIRRLLCLSCLRRGRLARRANS
jgi:hypothetical protein